MTHIDAGAELDPVHPVPLAPAGARADHRARSPSGSRAARSTTYPSARPAPPPRSSAPTSSPGSTRSSACSCWSCWSSARSRTASSASSSSPTPAIGIVQELRAKKTLDSLAVIGEARPTVRRDGRAAEISTSAIVLGDLIELGPGDKVVVDGEVAEADGLEIDESLLTGEADPVAQAAGRPGDVRQLRRRRRRRVHRHQGRPRGLRRAARRGGHPLHPRPLRAAHRHQPRSSSTSPG